MMLGAQHLDSDRVRQHTDPDAQALMDAQTRARLETLALEPAETLHERLRELDEEWDIERYLEVNASAFALSGVVLGALVDKRFLLLPAGVLGFLLQHAIQGWCPPLGIFRRLGKRTRREIDAERVAIKALLGHLEGTARDRGPPVQQARLAYRRAVT